MGLMESVTNRYENVTARDLSGLMHYVTEYEIRNLRFLDKPSSLFTIVYFLEIP